MRSMGTHTPYGDTLLLYDLTIKIWVRILVKAGSYCNYETLNSKNAHYEAEH